MQEDEDGMEALDLAGDLGDVSEFSISESDRGAAADVQRRVRKLLAGGGPIETNMLTAPEKR